MFDMSKEAVSETAAVHVKNAKGEHLYTEDHKPLRIHVYGPGTAAFAALEARQTQRIIRRRDENDGKSSVPPVDQAIAEQAEDLASITTSFENFGYPPAGDVQGHELFKALYADPKLGFITNQVQKFVTNWGNFSGASATN